MIYILNYDSLEKVSSKKPEISSTFIAKIKAIDEALIIIDNNKNCLFVNPAAKRMFGNLPQMSRRKDWLRLLNNFPSESVITASLDEFASLDSLSWQQRGNQSQVKASSQFSYEWNTQISKTETKYEESNVAVLQNMLKSTQIEKELLHSILYDRLTGLPNQNLFLKQTKQAIALAKKQQNYQFAVLFLDIDRFKVINSSLGRMLGDKLLVAISHRLRSCLRSEDLIARLGGDEFAILLEDIHDFDYATDIAERIYQQLLLPFELEGYEVFADAKIGIALGTPDYDEPDDLIRDAELAVSYAKKRSKNHYQVFNQDMHARAIKFLQLENDLRWAVQRQQLELHYQPILSLTNKRIVGFEALVRWRHPLRGIVSPVEFIPIAENTGLILSLGAWVLREACCQMHVWQTQFPEIADWKISVNISGKQLAQPNFVEQVKRILQETGLNPRNLKLEITESCLIEDTNSTIAILRHLKALGIEFSLDDFGTGYSSLSYLHMFPFNTLKIDRSFVNTMEGCSEKLGIIRAIVTLARNLNMDTIAEGLETANQLTQIKVLKCQYGQGYFFSKPLDKKATEVLIATELADKNSSNSENCGSSMEEQIDKEQLLFHIEQLRQQLEEIKQEKADLEILLETTTEHADLVESQLHKEINDRQKAEAALHQANQELERLSILDSLTQVANRRRFDDYLLQQWQRLRKENAPLSLILCDVDYFKLYNDAYGHPIGDHCLQQVALAIESALAQETDMVARYGGEEFAVILPNTDEETAMKIAEKIRSRVKSLKIAHHKSSVSDYVTLSLGVFSMIPNLEGLPELLISLADKALYEAKAQGRDRAILAMS